MDVIETPSHKTLTKKTLMDKIFLTLLAILTIGQVSCGNSNETIKERAFPAKTGYVNDYADVLSESQEKDLDLMIQKYESKSSVEIYVVTLDSSMSTLETFNSYILRLAGHWKIGKKDRRNGILIGISPHLQRVRISNGLGIDERLSDVETKRILNSIMFPEYQKARFYEGTKRGIEEIIEILK